jgi:O-succinylbenzoate synthase
MLRPFVTSFGATDNRHTVIVHLRDADGNEGWGEAPALDDPYYLPETVATSYAITVSHALPLALAADSVSPPAVRSAMSAIRGNTYARAGVEAAFHCLQAQAEGRSMQNLLGGTAERIPVGESVGIAEDIDDTLDEVHRRIDEGYQRIKLKIAPAHDVSVVATVRNSVGEQVSLQVDANGGYRLDDAGTLAELDDFGLLCIEQPLGWDELCEHAELQRLLGTPICLDESLRSLGDVKRALRVGACRSVNIKPGRMGGLLESKEAAQLCADSGVAVWCGGMIESGIGRAGNLALCSLESFTQPADMSPANVLFAEDLIDPTYTVDPDGTIAVPTGAGLGFSVRVDHLEAAAVRRTVAREVAKKWW